MRCEHLWPPAASCQKIPGRWSITLVGSPHGQPIIIAISINANLNLWVPFILLGPRARYSVRRTCVGVHRVQSVHPPRVCPCSIWMTVDSVVVDVLFFKSHVCFENIADSNVVCQWRFPHIYTAHTYTWNISSVDIMQLHVGSTGRPNSQLTYSG